MKTEQELITALRKEYAELNEEYRRVQNIVADRKFYLRPISDQHSIFRQRDIALDRRNAVLERIKLLDSNFFTICERCNDIINYGDEYYFDGVPDYYCPDCFNHTKKGKSKEISMGGENKGGRGMKTYYIVISGDCEYFDDESNRTEIEHEFEAYIVSCPNKKECIKKAKEMFIEEYGDVIKKTLKVDEIYRTTDDACL